jgi:hypothetical protein
MPGGPTDPEIILNAIAAGAVHDADRFAFGLGGGGPRVRFGLVASGPLPSAAWGLSTSGTIGIDADTFARLTIASVIEGTGGALLIDRQRFVLVEIEGMAELVPA